MPSQIHCSKHTGGWRDRDWVYNCPAAATANCINSQLPQTDGGAPADCALYAHRRNHAESKGQLSHFCLCFSTRGQKVSSGRLLEDQKRRSQGVIQTALAEYSRHQTTSLPHSSQRPASLCSPGSFRLHTFSRVGGGGESSLPVYARRWRQITRHPNLTFLPGPATLCSHCNK